MKSFRNLLVGVDLSYGDRFVGKEISEPNAEAIRRALWLAKLNQARVTFFSALDLSPQAQSLLKEEQEIESNVVNDANKALTKLVNQARNDGVEADSKVVFGKSWMEIIRQVLRERHDLVVVGTRHLGAVEGFFLGSTGTKLLRNCPCPVWVTMPPRDQAFDTILVAHDLRPVGDLALELGCEFALMDDAKLHVVHSAEYPELEYLLPAKVSAEKVAAYQGTANQHIVEQLAKYQLPKSADVYISNDPPEVAIIDGIKQYQADLLVIGTVGRTGIPGLITGNTAERLLPRISCSVLAVKPPEFVSPVTL